MLEFLKNLFSAPKPVSAQLVAAINQLVKDMASQSAMTSMSARSKLERLINTEPNCRDLLVKILNNESHPDFLRRELQQAINGNHLQ